MTRKITRNNNNFVIYIFIFYYGFVDENIYNKQFKKKETNKQICLQNHRCVNHGCKTSHVGENHSQLTTAPVETCGFKCPYAWTV